MLVRALVVVVVVVVIAGAVWGVRRVLEVRAVARYIDQAIVLPADSPPALLFRWFDTTHVDVQFTAGWEKFTRRVPRYQFRTEHPLWAKMHFEDWDRLPGRERETPLRNLLIRSGTVMHAGDCWPLMTAHDWDVVPQPVRAVAILGILEYWTRYYAVGERFEHEFAEMVQVVQAIVMSESWFEHRSVLVNHDGSRDLGLAGASAYARRVIAEWHAEDRLDFVFEDDDYFNPWHAGRFVAFWFDLMLQEAEGDVDIAIRAYNQGISRARAGRGDEYLAAVRRRERQFITARVSRSPTWNAIRLWKGEEASITTAPDAPCVLRPTLTQRTINSPRISPQPDSARMLQ